MENESNRLKPESEWIIADGKQPAIISEELFAAAQKRFQTEYSPKYRKPSVAVTHWLGGLLKCSACGCTLSTSKQTDKRYGRTYFHFQCCGYLKGTCSVSHSISEKKIVPHILEALNKVLDTHTMTFEIPDQTLPDTQSEQTLLQHALEKLNQKEARIKQAYRDGIDTIEEYKEQKELRKTMIKGARLNVAIMIGVFLLCLLLVFNITQMSFYAFFFCSLSGKIMFIYCMVIFLYTLWKLITMNK